MGGQEPFVAKLQQMFETNVPLYKKYDFLKQYPDMTGWIGMYSHGNEITWHIPYLYNYAGKPWMTQRRIRQILDLWYGDGPLGFGISLVLWDFTLLPPEDLFTILEVLFLRNLRLI